MNKYVSVIEDINDLVQLGFIEDGFHSWIMLIRDSLLSKIEIKVAGDYVFLSNKDPSRPYDTSMSNDIVTLWNRDTSGQISKEKLSQFVELIKEGNVRNKK